MEVIRRISAAPFIKKDFRLLKSGGISAFRLNSIYNDDFKKAMLVSGEKQRELIAGVTKELWKELEAANWPGYVFLFEKAAEMESLGEIEISMEILKKVTAQNEFLFSLKADQELLRLNGKMGTNDEAEKIYRRLLNKLDPNKLSGAQTDFIWAEILEKSDLLNEASAMFLRNFARFPNSFCSVKSLFRLSKLYKTTAQKKQERHAIELLLAHPKLKYFPPIATDSYLAMADLLFEDGKNQGAQVAYIIKSIDSLDISRCPANYIGWIIRLISKDELKPYFEKLSQKLYEKIAGAPVAAKIKMSEIPPLFSALLDLGRKEENPKRKMEIISMILTFVQEGNIVDDKIKKDISIYLFNEINSIAFTNPGLKNEARLNYIYHLANSKEKELGLKAIILYKEFVAGTGDSGNIPGLDKARIALWDAIDNEKEKEKLVKELLIRVLESPGEKRFRRAALTRLMNWYSNKGQKGKGEKVRKQLESFYNNPPDLPKLII